MKTAQNTISTPFVSRPSKTGSLHGRNLRAFVARANTAGKALVVSRHSNAYARLVLDDKLEDDQREQLGYATHMISRAKQAGKTPQEIWNSIQVGFGARSGQPMDLADMDDVKLGVLAFGAGVCSEDSQVAGSINEYIASIISGRTFAARALG